LERVRVHVRRDIAGTARICIVAPGSADFGILLDYQEVIHSRFQQLNRHSHAGESAPDYEDLCCVHPLARCTTSRTIGLSRVFGRTVITHRFPLNVGSRAVQVATIFDSYSATADMSDRGRDRGVRGIRRVPAATY